jgi:predicted GNAT family acetyltransferase
MKQVIEANKISIIEGDVAIAYVTFVNFQEDVVVIDHTYVSPAYRGHGLGRRLMETLVTVLETRKLTCVATCSYARAWFERHPEKQYLLKQK